MLVTYSFSIQKKEKSFGELDRASRQGQRCMIWSAFVLGIIFFVVPFAWERVAVNGCNMIPYLIQRTHTNNTIVPVRRIWMILNNTPYHTGYPPLHDDYVVDYVVPIHSGYLVRENFWTRMKTNSFFFLSSSFLYVSLVHAVCRDWHLCLPPTWASQP